MQRDERGRACLPHRARQSGGARGRARGALTLEAAAREREGGEAEAQSGKVNLTCSALEMMLWRAAQRSSAAAACTREASHIEIRSHPARRRSLPCPRKCQREDRLRQEHPSPRERKRKKASIQSVHALAARRVLALSHLPRPRARRHPAPVAGRGGAGASGSVGEAWPPCTANGDEGRGKDADRLNLLHRQGLSMPEPTVAVWP